MYLHAQEEGFKARIILGFDAAQIRGDDLAGFDKLGIESGIGIGYRLGDRSRITMDMLFSQRGSQNVSPFGTNIPLIRYTLNYIYLPVVFYFEDWEIEEDGNFSYNKVNVHGGLGYGRLLSSKLIDEYGVINPDVLQSQFNENDLSYILGLGINFTQRFGFEFRYNRSLTKLYKQTMDSPVNIGDLVPFHLSFRFNFTF